jgi:hypothetical protein
MKFTSHNRQYEVDKFGIVCQTDHRPFKYDAQYSAIYDSEKYRRGNDILQALRYGFACAAHGKPIKSIMDIGYGNAAFIDFAKQQVPYVYGYDITGVPLNGAYQMPEFVKADVYTFNDCLEHFPAVDFLQTMPCETVCISLPYCHFITHGKDWFDNDYLHRKPDEHIRHMNEHSLANLMNHYGWRTVALSGHEDIVRKSTHGLQNNLTMAFKRQ